MPTAAYVKIPAANEDLAETINCATDQWSIALSAGIPGSKVFTAGTTDLATSGGYTAGGSTAAAATSSSMVGSDLVVVLADPATWTATGGGFTFRYALLVNKTVLSGAGGTILGYWDYGSSQVVAAGETVVVDLDQTASVGTFKLT